MTIVYLILLLLAIVFFALHAFNVVSARINLMSLGLMCWAGVVLLRLIHTM